MSFLLSFSWDLCCGTFLINARVFRFYRHCPSFTTASLLVSNTPSYGSRFFSSWEERWSGRIAFPFPHLPGFHCYNPGQKSLGQYCNIHIFLSFLGSLLKQCILFEIFLQFSLPHPIQSWNSEKILDTRVQHCLWGEGRGWTCVNWKTPQKCKSVPRLLSMIVW